MTDNPYLPPDLDKVLHERSRLSIVSVLVAQNEMDFVSLKKLLNLSDGNLNTHLKVLEKNKYIQVKKAFVKRKPRTTYRLTPKGRQGFQHYIDKLEEIVRHFSPA